MDSAKVFQRELSESEQPRFLFALCFLSMRSGALFCGGIHFFAPPYRIGRLNKVSAFVKGHGGSSSSSAPGCSLYSNGC